MTIDQENQARVERGNEGFVIIREAPAGMVMDCHLIILPYTNRFVKGNISRLDAAG